MTTAEFLKFRQTMATRMAEEEDLLSQRKTADLLGCTRHLVRKWSVEDPPDYIGYACLAILHGLVPWRKPNTMERTL